MTEAAETIENRFARFRELAGGDNLAGAALVLAHALAETRDADDA